MKTIYYVKIIRSLDGAGVILSFPSLPNIPSINCKNIDEAVFTAKRVLIDFCRDEEFLPLPLTYIGEEFYPIHIDLN